jgi:transglutaminase-like putative cysteine protease
MPRKISILLLFLFVSLFAVSQESRHFTFEYAFTVRVTDPGKPLDIWFPLAQSDQFQQVQIVSKSGDLPLKETRESEYRNAMLYAHTDKADKSEYHFSVKYDVIRHEHLMSVFGPARASAASLRRFLEPDKLVPITGLPAEIAAKQVKPEMSEMQKARALYNYTLVNMRYDKSGTGWGHGDTLWACDAKRGNCTDFHSLFISMTRSQHIPGRFEIGFPLPTDKSQGEVPGYHCWAEFYTRERGWVPVDISEAWKHQEKRDYFFGAHDVNRVQFSVGRDLELSPRQRGERLNYFVYPYVELDGKEYSNIANAFSFADVKSVQRASAKASQ